MIYFHANAEDIVLSHELLDFIRVLLKVNVVAVEYPGYGLYTEKMQQRYKYTTHVNPHVFQSPKPEPNNFKKAKPKNYKDLEDEYDSVRNSVYEPKGFFFQSC